MRRFNAEIDRLTVRPGEPGQPDPDVQGVVRELEHEVAVLREEIRRLSAGGQGRGPIESDDAFFAARGLSLFDKVSASPRFATTGTVRPQDLVDLSQAWDAKFVLGIVNELDVAVTVQLVGWTSNDPASAANIGGSFSVSSGAKDAIFSDVFAGWVGVNITPASQASAGFLSAAVHLRRRVRG